MFLPERTVKPKGPEVVRTLAYEMDLMHKQRWTGSRDQKKRIHTRSQIRQTQGLQCLGNGRETSLL